MTVILPTSDNLQNMPTQIKKKTKLVVPYANIQFAWNMLQKCAEMYVEG
jgi:hypothetical protein